MIAGNVKECGTVLDAPGISPYGVYITGRDAPTEETPAMTTTTTSPAAIDRDTLERIAIILQSNPRIKDRTDMLEMVRSIQSGRCDDYHWTQQALSAALARNGVNY